MADEADKETEAAEKAYAAAAEAVSVKPEAPVKAPAQVETLAAPVADKAAPEAKPAVVKTAVAKPVATKPAKKPAARKAAKPVLARIAKPKTAAAKPATPKAPAKKLLSANSTSSKPVTKLKELIMAKTPDFTKTVTDAVAELQTRAKAAYEKGTEVAGEVSDFTKGNVEALIESGKILSEGVQGLGKTYADEAKSALETATADLKEIAAIKSPTELFQLQGKLIRRNFDTFVAFSSKNSEALLKLANESAAPISSRLSLAADKVAKAAA